MSKGFNLTVFNQAPIVNNPIKNQFNSAKVLEFFSFQFDRNTFKNDYDLLNYTAV